MGGAPPPRSRRTACGVVTDQPRRFPVAFAASAASAPQARGPAAPGSVRPRVPASRRPASQVPQDDAEGERGRERGRHAHGALRPLPGALAAEAQPARGELPPGPGAGCGPVLVSRPRLRPRSLPARRPALGGPAPGVEAAAGGGVRAGLRARWLVAPRSASRRESGEAAASTES